jgi:uncharacterized membrane protein YbhN (UPF0104 family)
MSGVKNKVYITEIRRNLSRVKREFIVMFAVATVCYLLDRHLRDHRINIYQIQLIRFDIRVDFSALLFSVMLYSIVYYIIIFSAIQKLRYDIFDKVNK